MRRCITSWPLMVLALLLLLLCLSRSVAAARLLPLQQPAGVRPLVPTHQDNGVTAAAADGLVIQEDEAAGDGDELSISEMMGEGAEQAVACEEEGNDDDECLQRRLLLFAHLDHRDYSSRAKRRPPARPSRP